MPEFETATGVIHYELLDATGVSAPGETLTLLHNFMSTGRAAWGPLLESLNERYRILLPDLPGHGRSVGHPLGFNHRIIAEQLAALIGYTDADRGHLAGCSSGGMLAQLLVHLDLMQPGSLTLVSTTHSVASRETGSGARLLPEDFQAGDAWMEATARLHDPFHYDGYYQEIVLAGFRRLTGKTAIDLPLSAFNGWSLPVCIIHGERDEFFPPEIPRGMADALPAAELTLIPRQTHALIFRQPWKVAEVMMDFLGRHPLNEYPTGL